MRAILNRRKKFFQKASNKEGEEPGRLYTSTSCYELANGEVQERQPIKLRTKSTSSYDCKINKDEGKRYSTISLENLSGKASSGNTRCINRDRIYDYSTENMYISNNQPRSRRSFYDKPTISISSVSTNQLSNGYEVGRNNFYRSENSLRRNDNRSGEEEKSVYRRRHREYALSGIDSKTSDVQDRVINYSRKQENVESGFGDLQARLKKLREGVNSLLNRHTTVNDKIENCKELDHVDSELEWNYYLKANRLLEKAVSLVLLDVSMKDRIIGE